MFWIYHGAVILVLLLVTGMTLCNLFIFRTARPIPGRQPESTVSVLIPARNEAARIGPCLKSLAGQNDCEVIVLNDNSEDDTAAVVESFGFSRDKNARLRLIDGKPLPAGWRGKSWACHQLAAAATGDYLLFTDADTIHFEGGVAGAVHHAKNTRADLLSAWPDQITVTFWEKMIISLGYLLVLGFLPLVLLSLLQRFPFLARRIPREWVAKLGGANGQHLLFRREAYQSIGGHEAVRNHMVEDLSLGRLAASHTADGFRLVNCDGSHLLRCRMYTSFADIWEGFTKNLRPAFDDDVVTFWMSLLIQLTVFVSPFVLVFFWASARPLLLAEIGCIYLLRLLPTLKYRTSWLGMILHPLAHSTAILIAVNSWMSWGGQGVQWKGRNYQP